MLTLENNLETLKRARLTKVVKTVTQMIQKGIFFVKRQKKTIIDRLKR